ncbi:hypothetical protein JCM10212_004455 [Sporobolomyces blumeae]
MATHPNPGSIAPHRRRGSRRLEPEGEGESSREASAESNDETTTSGLSEDDAASLTSPAGFPPHAPHHPHPPSSHRHGAASSLHAQQNASPSSHRRSGAGLSPHSGFISPVETPLSVDPVTANVGGLHLGREPPAVPAMTTASSRTQRTSFGGETTEGEDSAGHDGDISSAPAPDASLGARMTSTQPHVPRAPVHLHAQFPSPSNAAPVAPAVGAGAPNAPHLVHAASSFESTGASSATSPLARTVSLGHDQPGEGGGGGNEADVDSSEVPGTSEGERGRDQSEEEDGGRSFEKKEPSGGDVLWAAAPKGFLSNLTAEEIQEHIRSAIAGQPGRAYKIKPPPVGRPVRIYADGVYDLLHYGHMLQLRQCKLAFPSVHLLVGCCSSSLVRQHKAQPVLTSEERYESLRHVRWVDEVVEDAPWTVDGDFIEKWQIDYVAHDEEPYVSAGQSDCYAYAKSIGAFLPTKRTNGVSTSEVLQRIVEGYREGDYDGKLRKIGHPELCSRQGSEAGTGYGGSVRKE